MRRSAHETLDDLLGLFQDWVDVSLELRTATLQHSPDVPYLNQRAHDTLRTYLDAMGTEVNHLDQAQTDGHESHLQMARRHVAGGRRIVAEQEQRIENLRRDGLDTTRAAELLNTERKVLAEMQALLVHENEALLAQKTARVRRHAT